MDLIADGLLIAATSLAAIYCVVLSRRLRALKNLDKGLGAAIAGLSREVDSMQTTLRDAKRVAQASSGDLRVLTKRAETAAGRLELLLAAMHDSETGGIAPRSAASTARPVRRTPQTTAASAVATRAPDPAHRSDPASVVAARPSPELRTETRELPQAHPAPEPAPPLRAMPTPEPRQSLSDLLAKEEETDIPTLPAAPPGSDLSLPADAPVAATPRPAAAPPRQTAAQQPSADRTPVTAQPAPPKRSHAPANPESDDDLALRDMLANRPSIRDALRDLLKDDAS